MFSITAKCFLGWLPRQFRSLCVCLYIATYWYLGEGLHLEFGLDGQVYDLVGPGSAGDQAYSRSRASTCLPNAWQEPVANFMSIISVTGQLGL